MHYPPVAWPAEPVDPKLCGSSCGEWKPYTRFQNDIADPRTQEPSNGGTSPQNYVNIASSCVDKSFPSIYYALRQGAASDGSQDVIMFRWRVEQIANNYATEPSAGSYGASDPWSSALWSVLFDVNGDGFIDLAAHLDGSSGSPSAAIDRIVGIWSKLPTQSLDYLGDPTNVKLLIGARGARRVGRADDARDAPALDPQRLRLSVAATSRRRRATSERPRATAARGRSS